MEDGFKLNAKTKKKKDVSSLLKEIDSLETTIVLPSAIQKKVEKKSEKQIKEEEAADDDWLDTILTFDSPKSNKKKNKKKKKEFRGFTVEEKEKAEKKKKKKDGNKDYRREFSTELNTLHNLLQEQSRFTESLQKKYDDMEKTKASTKGVGKFTTDLISGITQARSTGLQIVKETINVKKTIADLNMKERKENGPKDGGGDNAAYASTYLSQLMKAGRSNIVNTGYSYDASSSDDDEDSLLDAITDSLGDTSRPDEVDRYLKYENDDVEITVCMNQNDYTDFYFVATDKKGKEIEDYPMPGKTKMTVNESTGKATDIYGQKYRIEWQ